MSDQKKAMKWFEIEETVRSNEVDEGGLAWYGHYMAWFDVARDALLRTFDLLPKQIDKMGYLAPVINLQCDYKQPAFSGDRIIIRVRVEKPETAALVFQFEILKKEGLALIARGETTHVLMTQKNKAVHELEGEFEKRVALLVDCFIKNPQTNA